MDINDKANDNDNDNDIEQPNKKVKLNEKEEEKEEACAICLESNGLLPRHGCTQCTQTAFQICGDCHQSCLSRLCPLCRGEYAPVIYHPYPIPIAIPFIPANYPDPIERFKATISTSFSLELIGKVNTAAWCPEEQIMHFVLPIEKDKVTDSVLASIKLNDDQFVNDSFHFTNKVWDLLEQKAIDEEGLEDEDDSVGTEGDGPDRNHDPDEATYCTCKRVEYGYMINCTKPDCPIKWFHFRCVGLSRATTPTSPWYCSTCITETEDVNQNNVDQEPNLKIIHEEQKQAEDTETEGVNQNNVDQEPNLKIVHEEQKQAEDNGNEVLNESLNDSTELRQRDNNNPTSSDLEFSQASAPDARKWLVSKLMKPTTIFMTEVEEKELLEIFNEIIPPGMNGL